VSVYKAYAFMLLLPVLLTVAVIGLPALFGDILPIPGALGVFVYVLLGVFGIVGIPYMVMAVGLVAWAQDRPAQTIRRAANLAPVILWLLVLLWWSIIWLGRGLGNPPFPKESMLRLFAAMSALVLGIGYLWVVLAHGLVRWLAQKKAVVDAA
jgi:hypothetical protein